MVASEVSWLCNATRQSEDAHDTIVAELVRELERVHDYTEELVARQDDDRKALDAAIKTNPIPEAASKDAWAEARRPRGRERPRRRWGAATPRAPR